MQRSLLNPRGHLLMRFLLIVIAIAIGSTFIAASAYADQPVKQEFAVQQTGTLTDVCSFTVDVKANLSGFETAYFDQSGTLTRILDEVEEQDTFTANGKTLIGEPFRFSIHDFFDSSGNVTQAYADGVTERVPLPDGDVYFSAGRLIILDHPGEQFVISADKGNPGDIAAFCAALSP